MASVVSYETAKGKRWMVRYRKPGGASTDKRGFATKRQAETWLQETEVDKRAGRYVDPAAGKIPLRDLAEDWHVSLVDLKLSTRSRHRYTLDNQVLPTWGEYYVTDLTAPQLQRWIAGMSDEGLSASTVRKAHGCLSMILDAAVRDRRIPSNPCKGLRLPRQTRDEPTFLTMRQLLALSDAAGAFGPVMLVLGLTGLRWGEMAALKTKRWNSTRRRLTVAESVSEVDGQLQWGTPKTHEVRTVPVLETVANLLDSATEGKGPDDLIFTTPGGQVLRNNNARRDWFDDAVLAAFPPATGQETPSIEITPHDLRHTAASLAISVGANVKSVQRMLGHASAVMTLDLYAGLFDDDLDSVADALQAAIVAETTDNVIALRG